MIAANEARGVSGQLFISGTAPNCFPISHFRVGGRKREREGAREREVVGESE